MGKETPTRSLALSVPSRLRGLDLEARRQFEIQFQCQVRSEETTVVLLWCLGLLGAHRFYLGQRSLAAVFLSAFVGGVSCVWLASATQDMSFAALGCTVLFIEVVAVIADIVRHESITKKANLVVKDRVLRDLERETAGKGG